MLLLLRMWTSIVDKRLFNLAPHSTELRETILSSNSNAVLNMSLRLEAMYQYAINHCDQQLQDTTYFIWFNFSNIAGWHVLSQRIYRVSDTLMQNLLNTDIPHGPAEEISFVSDSFVIQLETPLHIEGLGHVHDFLFCEFDENIGDLSITSYPGKYDHYHSFTLRDRKRFTNSSDSSKKSSVHWMCRHVGWNKPQNDLTHHIIVPGAASYEEIALQCFSGADSTELITLLKIVIGLNVAIKNGMIAGAERPISFIPPKTTRGKSVLVGTEVFELNAPTGMRIPFAIPQALLPTG
ncbi:MAG: hypothetical protein V4576_04215 [Patescibacteria group bacterium]